MYNHNTAIYLNFKDFSSVFICFFEYKNCIFANKCSILNIPNFIQYLKHKIQTFQGNPALILNIFALVFIKNTLSAKKSEKVFSQLSQSVVVNSRSTANRCKMLHPGLKFAPH